MPEEPFEQKEPLICKFEKKGRNGKPVTIIEGFEGNDDMLKQISKKIKNYTRNWRLRKKMELSSYKEIIGIR